MAADFLPVAVAGRGQLGQQGRVDRFGQTAPVVRATLLYGKNPVDGIVLEAKGFWVIGLLKVIVEAVKNIILNAQLESRLRNS